MKKYLTLSVLILLTSCGTPGSALLGPAFTGATTKSVAQASLSFGTNQIIRKIDEAAKKSKKEVKKIVKKIDKLQLNNYSNKHFHFSK